MPQQQARDIGLLGFPFSKGQSKNGTQLGPEVMREGGILESLQSVGNNIEDHGDVEIETVAHDEPIGKILFPRTVGAANKKLSEATSKILRSNKSVVTMGGDHSMAIGSINGHAQAEPNLVIVWVDAHADINPPLESLSGNIHGMPLAFLARELEDFVPKLPGFDWCKPCISVRDIVYIGLRDVDPGERSVIDKFNMNTFTMKDIDQLGIEEVVIRALNVVDPSHTRPIHVSFDVDALDPKFTPATGTPVPGGMSLKEALHVANEIAKTGRLSVLDIAEVNPLLSNEEQRKLTISNTLEVVSKFHNTHHLGASRDFSLPRPQ